MTCICNKETGRECVYHGILHPSPAVPVQSPDQLRWDAIIKWAHANVPDAVVAIRDLAKEVVDAREERDKQKGIAAAALQSWKDRSDLLGEEIGLRKKTEAANAELIRLLERHHAAMLAENRLHPADDLLYSDIELCRETEAAIERAKGKA